jgi:hypothetical protein
MSSNAIDTLTAQAFAAHNAGDAEAAQQAFEQRDAVAKADSGEAVESAPDIGADGIDAAALDQIGEIIISTGNAEWPTQCSPATYALRTALLRNSRRRIPN